MSPTRLIALVFALLCASAARAEPAFVPGDAKQRPAASGTVVMPERILRGFDPVTAYFDHDRGRTGPDDAGAKVLSIEPAFPGAWTWVDARTLQFRPAEPWPALARFQASAGGQVRTLVTLMQAPSGVVPADGSTELAPFRTVTLTFPAALPLDSLRRMLSFELRQAPGLADSPRVPVKSFELAAVPRPDHRAVARYVVTFPEPVPEGRVLVMTAALALGEGDETLWSARATTRTPFRLEGLSCGGNSLDLVGGRKTSLDRALACGNHGQAPVVRFSAPLGALTLTEAKRLVKLDPAVPDLDVRASGASLALTGTFQPDLLYRLRLTHTPLKDRDGRTLEQAPDTEAFFYQGWKSAYLRWDHTNVLVEAKGPRVLPMTGYGDARADVRIHRIDPLFPALWPFPSHPVAVAEEEDPPFPGEEPSPLLQPQRHAQSDRELVAQLRLLGSPLVSRIVELPKGAATKGGRFGLDVGPLVDGVVGPQRPGTYLVGVRRLTGEPVRHWVRLTATNLSVSTVAEHGLLNVFVRTLDTAEPVAGAVLHFDGMSKGPRSVPVTFDATTDATGRIAVQPLATWSTLTRITVTRGEDVLVLDPDSPPPAFANGHWSSSDAWFDWLLADTPDRPNEALLPFLFTERPVYKPGETVHLKGFLRWKKDGRLGSPGDVKSFALEVVGPDGTTRALKTSTSAFAGFDADFEEKEAPTGQWTAQLVRRQPYEVLATRPFKVEAYRLPTFEVQVTGPQVARLDGPFSVKAVARYFAGGLVSGAPVEWQVTRRPTWHTPASFPGFLFASSTQFSRPGGPGGPTRTSERDTLKDDGTDDVTVNPAIDPDGTPRIYRFEATVTGPDDQQVTASHEVRALPPFVLGLQLERFLPESGRVVPKVVAVGVDDKALPGQSVTVRLKRRVWNSTLRETNFATGEAKYVTEREDRKVAEKTVETTKAPLEVPFDVKEPGVYVVELEARDQLGRVQVLEADLYVSRPGEVAWQKPRDGVFRVTPDKATYRAGDVATLVLQSPFQQAWALVVVEQPLGNEYAWVKVSGGQATHKVTIRAEHVPNLHVHALLQRGRLGEGPGDDSRFRPQTLGASLELEVEPVTNRVNVSLQFPESVRPATTVDVRVKLGDEKQKPLPGEVTLWLVDEAALSLGREGPLDPVASFVPRNGSTTSIRDTRNTVIGRLLGLDELPGGDGDESEDLLGGKLVVRRTFKTVPYWSATLAVPSSGELVVKVPLADDLTNFAVRAVATSGWERFGFAQGRLRVRLPVLVQPSAPRFVRVGDRFFPGAIARVVEGPGGDAKVQLAIEGPATVGASPTKATLDPLKPSRFELPVEVGVVGARNPTELVLRAAVKRNADGAGDAVEVRLPVRLDRHVERRASLLSLKVGDHPLPPFPSQPRTGSAEVTVSATTVPGLLSVVTALESLDSNPHQSLATRVTRLLPALEQASFLERLGLATYAKQALKHGRVLLDTLSEHQDDSGLFGDWPGAPGSELVTVWTLEFLQVARRHGLPVDPKQETRAVDGLRRVLRSDWPGFYETLRENQRVAALRGLAIASRIDQPYAQELFERRAALDAESLAHLSESLLSDPRTFARQLDVLRTDTWDRVIFKLHDGQPRFEGILWGRASWYGGWFSSETTTVSAMLQSLSMLTPTDARLLLIRDALVARADPVRGFGGGPANRAAIRAIGTWLDVARVGSPPAKVVLGTTGTLELKPGHELSTLRTPETAPLVASVSGAPVQLRIGHTWLPEEPGSRAKPDAHGFVVARTMTVLRGDATPETFADDPGTARELKVGDVVELHARIESPVPRYHVAFTVPFAACLEPLNPELANAPPEATPSQSDSLRPTFVQRLDDEYRYVFASLPAGTHTFHARLRVVSRGEFTHPSPWAEQVYLPGPTGRGAGQLLRVSE